MPGGCIYNLRVRARVNLIRSGDASLSSQSEKLLLEAADPLTLTVITVLPNTFIEQNSNSPNDSDVKTPDVDLGWNKTGTAYDDA